VLGKVFTEHTHIVAVKATGNVYSWEAVEELNIKAKNWKDLLTDEPFTRKDILHIQVGRCCSGARRRPGTTRLHAPRPGPPACPAS
jgi:hypothetical protein